MHRFLQKAERALRNPYFELALAIILMVCGFAEAGQEIWGDIRSGQLGAHHGVIAFGLAHGLKALSSILAGIVLFAEAERENH